MAKVSNEELIKVVQVYNDEGRTAAYDLLRSKYGVKNPYFVIKRIKNDPRFEYNQDLNTTKIEIAILYTAK